MPSQAILFFDNRIVIDGQLQVANALPREVTIMRQQRDGPALTEPLAARERFWKAMVHL